MIRVCWRSTVTGHEGFGEWQPNAKRELLQSWIDALEKESAMRVISHWIEDDADGEAA
jgi:hypothetical protein